MANAPLLSVASLQPLQTKSTVVDNIKPLNMSTPYILQNRRLPPLSLRLNVLSITKTTSNPYAQNFAPFCLYQSSLPLSLLDWIVTHNCGNFAKKKTHNCGKCVISCTKYAIIFCLSCVEAKKYPNCGHDAWPSGGAPSHSLWCGAVSQEMTKLPPAGSNEAFVAVSLKPGKAVNIYYKASS